MNADVQLNFYLDFGILTVCITINTVFLNTSYRKHPEVKIWVLKLHKTHQWRRVRETEIITSKAASEDLPETAKMEKKRGGV